MKKLTHPVTHTLRGTCRIIVEGSVAMNVVAQVYEDEETGIEHRSDIPIRIEIKVATGAKPIQINMSYPVQPILSALFSRTSLLKKAAITHAQDVLLSEGYVEWPERPRTKLTGFLAG
jgi:hypothetical protein